MNDHQTIEQYFLQDYIELKKEVEQFRRSSERSSIFDLCSGIELIKVETASSYHYTNPSCKTAKMTVNDIRKLLNKSNEELKRWAVSTETSPYGPHYISETKSEYTYTVEIALPIGKKKYAINLNGRDNLVCISDSASLGEWAHKDQRQELMLMATEEVRENLRNLLETKLKEASENEDN